MKFSVIVPARNEAENLKVLLPRLRDALAPFDCEIIVVNNGSTDASSAVIADFKKTMPNLVMVLEPIPGFGYGRGILDGLKIARGDTLGIIRADNQERPEDFANMYRFFLEEKLDVLKAVRKSRTDVSFLRIVTSKIFNLLFKIMFHSRVRDINATPKIFTRAFYEHASLESQDWFIDTEIVIKAEYYTYTLKEFEIEYLPRLKGKSNVRPSDLCQFLINMTKWSIRRGRKKL